MHTTLIALLFLVLGTLKHCEFSNISIKINTYDFIFSRIIPLIFLLFIYPTLTKIIHTPKGLSTILIITIISSMMIATKTTWVPIYITFAIAYISLIILIIDNVYRMLNTTKIKHIAVTVAAIFIILRIMVALFSSLINLVNHQNTDFISLVFLFSTIIILTSIMTLAKLRIVY